MGMSDTPETDTLYFSSEFTTAYDMAGLCKKLERERDEKQYRIEKLIFMIDNLANPSENHIGLLPSKGDLEEINRVLKSAITNAEESDEVNDPKGEIGKTKCPLHLLPPTALSQTAWVHKLGADKYGAFNWRETNVCATTYISAMMRHLLEFSEGTNLDYESGWSHLAHISANCNILMDAMASETLIDDRHKVERNEP